MIQGLPKKVLATWWVMVQLVVVIADSTQPHSGYRVPGTVL